MATVQDLEQQFLAAQLGLAEPLPSINDLRYLFYLGVKTGELTLATTDASEIISGTLDPARLPTITTNTKTVTPYTVTLDDAHTMIEMNLTVANSVIIPANTSAAFPIGSVIAIRQYGTGQTSVAPASGVVIRSRGGAFNFAGQFSEAALTKRGLDEWVLTGDVIV